MDLKLTLTNYGGGLVFSKGYFATVPTHVIKNVFRLEPKGTLSCSAVKFTKSVTVYSVLKTNFNNFLGYNTLW